MTQLSGTRVTDVENAVHVLVGHRRSSSLSGFHAEVGRPRDNPKILLSPKPASVSLFGFLLLDRKSEMYRLVFGNSTLRS